MPKTSKYTAKTPQPDGEISYSPEENAVWADLYARQEPAIRKHAARAYLAGFDKLGLPSDRVPGCPDVSEALQALTGWSVVPVPALIGFKTFFAMLAARQFPAASFIRSRADFDYIEEPDIFHEMFGHTPLLTDPRIAAFSEAVGRAGVRAEASEYAWLIRLYWFTVEFGLTRESGVIKALGSGLASSPTELVHGTCAEGPERRGFDVLDILRTPYRIDIPQVIYYVVDGPDQLLAASERDLLADVRDAQALGLFAPTYPEKAA